MPSKLIFLPVLIQICIVFWLYIRLAVTKKQAIQLGQVDQQRRSLHEDSWPDTVIQINNCIKNQFQAPVLFYVVIFILWNLNLVNYFVHIIAWLFVISRVFHAYIHAGSNFVPLRRQAFVSGIYLLMALSIYAFYGLFAG
jgi:hypothetical protein